MNRHRSHPALCTLLCVMSLVALHCASPDRGAAPTGNSTGAELFLEAAADSGLRFEHFIGSTGQFYMPEIMGAGVGLIDYDNDGDLDVILLQGRMLDESKPLTSSTFALPEGERLGHRLFRNELIPGGALRFTDVTAEAGLGQEGYGMGVAVGDIDNDGFPDIYITQFGENILLRNLGNGRFEDITKRAGVGDPRWSTSAAFLDYNRDGLLDLFVLNYLDFTVQGHKECQAPTGEPDYCTPKAYEPVTATLYRNEGGGRFRDVTSEAQLDRARGPGLGITITDADGDGWPDLYVANDGMANLLWMNQSDGTFRETGLASGAAYAEDGVARAGMGVAAGDFDNDGDDDLFVVNLSMEGATLFRNDGAMGFLDITKRVGLASITYPLTGFGARWIDFDNDGWLDLFVANGAVTRIESLRGQPYPFPQRNLLIRNSNGERFADITEQAGAALALVEVSRGAAFGDIDNDGDVDIVISNNNGPVRLLLNQTVDRGGPPAIALRALVSDRHALGASIRIESNGTLRKAQTIRGDSSYLSASDPTIYVPRSLVHDGASVRIVVRWPDGKQEEFPWGEVARERTLRQGTGHSVQP